MNYLLRRRKLGRGSCRGIKQFSQTGIQVFRNDRRLPAAETIFRWGCTSDLPQHQHTVNTAEAIHAVSDKRAFRMMLDEADLCPATWFRREDILLPCIIRPSFHAQGRRLYFCQTAEEVDAAILRCPEGWYAAAFVNKVSEYRVFVAQGRAVWVANKIPGNPQDIAWNVARGGKFENVRWDDWPLKAVRVSIEAFEMSGLDFGGVDVMADREGEMHVLEINAAPSQTSAYRQECTAKAFDYIVRHGKQAIPLIEERGGYRKFIHPGVCAEAQIPA